MSIDLFIDLYKKFLMRLYMFVDIFIKTLYNKVFDAAVHEYSCSCFSVADIVRRVNLSLDNDTIEETHTLLQKPEGKFPKVLKRSAFLYHDELRKVKSRVTFTLCSYITSNVLTSYKQNSFILKIPSPYTHQFTTASFPSSNTTWSWNI